MRTCSNGHKFITFYLHQRKLRYKKPKKVRLKRITIGIESKYGIGQFYPQYPLQIGSNIIHISNNRIDTDNSEILDPYINQVRSLDKKTSHELQSE